MIIVGYSFFCGKFAYLLWRNSNLLGFLILPEFLSYQLAVMINPLLNGVFGSYPIFFSFVISGHLLLVPPSAGFPGTTLTFFPKYLPTSIATCFMEISSIVPIL